MSALLSCRNVLRQMFHLLYVIVDQPLHHKLIFKAIFVEELCDDVDSPSAVDLYKLHDAALHHSFEIF